MSKNKVGKNIMNDEENLALKSGFIGEKKRDASSSIRGFVYQNLLAIEELIKENTDRVFCEYVEDITSIDKNGNCKIIQAKYYTSKLPLSMEEEVFREMYCQYLKLLKDGNLQSVIPVLSVFSPGNKSISLPDKKKAVEWINDNSKSVTIDNLSDLDTRKLDKAEREFAIIKLCGNQENLDAYHAAYTIDQRKTDLDKLRLNLGKDLVELMKDQLEESSLEVLDEGDKLEKVLLGLAYLKIIETFDRMAGKINEDEEDDKILRHKEIRRSDFIEYLKSHIGENNDSIIRSVQSIVMDVFFSVLANNPDMDVLQSQIFETIVNNTVKWMSELLADSTGQAAFYNSVSFESRERVMKFAGFTVRKREKAILMCFPGIQSFLKYLWKIMLNICMSKVKFDFKKDANLMDPQYYIVESEKEYICFKFKTDFVKSSIILPPINSDEGKEKRKQIYSRMYYMKPEKWFMGGDTNKYGRYDYAYRPSEIVEDLYPVSSIQADNDYFYLECMECIGIDGRDWMKTEACEKCIFSRECRKENHNEISGTI